MKSVFVRPHARMYAKGYHYYKSNRMVHLIIRFWVSNSICMILQKLFWTLIVISCFSLQVTPFFTTALEMNNIVKDLPFMALTLIFVVKCGQFFVSKNTINKLINNVYESCDKLEDDQEYKIIQNCIDTGESFAIFLTICVSPAFIGIGLFPLYPFVHDILAMCNETRPIELPIDLEYFVDQKKYFVFILIHLGIICVICLATLIVNETIVVILGQHTCAFFRISSYRIEHAMDSCTWPSASDKQCVASRQIVKALEAYRMATEFLDNINKTFGPCYTVQLVLFVPAVSINLYLLSQAVLLLNNLQNLFIFVFILLGQLGYLFMINHAGQTVTNCTDEVFHCTYKSLWYIAPVSAQKLLLGAMVRSMKPHIFKLVGGLYASSFQGFATVVRLCVSYYMFMHSTQQDTP